jgi:predicted aldo/keto reductase-like oxidoreductase
MKMVMRFFLKKKCTTFKFNLKCPQKINLNPKLTKIATNSTQKNSKLYRTLAFAFIISLETNLI